MSDIVIPGNPERDRVKCSSSIASSLRASRFSDVPVSEGLLVRLVELDMQEPGWFKVQQSGVIFSIVLSGSYESSYFRRRDSDVRGSSLRIYALEQKVDQLISFREPSSVRLLQLAVDTGTVRSIARSFGYDGDRLLKSAKACCRNGNSFSVPNRALPRIVRSVAEEAFSMVGGIASRPMLLYAKAIEILSHGFDYLLDNDCEADHDTDMAAKLEDVRRALEAQFRGQCCNQFLAERSGLPGRTLVDQFKARFGMSPAAFLVRLKMFEARRLIEESSTPVSRIAREVGFADHAAFTRAFVRFFGRTPSSFR